MLTELNYYMYVGNMKTKTFVLFILTTFLVTDAAEVTDEDINSPLVSYLLARIEQLESKMMDKPSIRKTSEIVEKSTEQNAVAASNEKCTCPPAGVVTYVRWGNSTCPYGADTIYSGVVAGSWFDHYGSAVDPLCLPHNPQYLKSQAGYQYFVQLYGAEYETHSSSPINQAHDRNLPCALCQAYGRTNKIMIPSRYECPPGWNTEYYGYLMAGHYTHKAATQFTCVDRSLEQVPGSGADTNGKLFYTVEAHCNQFIPCSDKELTCVVCTK